MKINKIFLVGILLLAILTIGAVSAADDMNLTASDGGDDTIIDSSIGEVEVDDNELGATNDSELSVSSDINVELENNAGEVDNGFYIVVYTDGVAEWGSDVPIHFKVPEGALGTINFTFNGKHYDTKLDDNPDPDSGEIVYNAIIKKEDVICGFNNIVAKYAPSSKDSPFEEKTFKVNMPVLPKIHFSSYDVDYNGKDTIWLSLPFDATGKLFVTIDGESYTVNQDNGKYVFHYPLLDPDDYEVTVKYLGDDYEIDYGVDDTHKPLTSVTQNITIHPYLNVTSINWDRDKLDMSVVVPSKYSGKVTFLRDATTDGERIVLGTAVIKDGIAAASFKVGPGGHEIVAHVECGDYEGESNVKTVEVVYESSKWNMNLDVQNMIRKDDNQLLASLKNLPEHIKLYENDNIILKIDGVEFNQWSIHDSFNQEILIDSSNLNYGKHSFELIFLGDGYFEPNKASGFFEVGNASVHAPKEYDINRWYNVNVKLPKDATGVVALYLDGKKIDSQKIVDSDDSEDYLEVYFDYYGLTEKYGIHNISVRKTSGNYQFRLDTTVNLTYNLYADESVVYGEDKLYIYGPGDDKVSGQVSVRIDGRSYINVSGTYDDNYEYCYYVNTHSNLAPGTHNISISYSGDSLRPPKTVQSTFEVIPTVFYDTEHAHVGDGISLLMPNDARGNLIVLVDNKLYKTVKANGRVFISLDNVSYGHHKVEVMYDGDDYYVHTQKADSLEVTKLKVPEKMYYKGNDAVSVELPSDLKGKLVVEYWDSNNDKKSVEKELVNGNASIPLSMLPSGGQSILVTVKYDYLGHNDSYDCQFDIDVVNPISSGSSALYSSKYAIKVIDDNRKPVSDANVVVYLDGKKVKTVKTNSNGYAYYTVDKAPKTYTLKLDWKGHVVSKKLKVTHVLTLKSVAVKKSAKKLVLTATLKKVNGKYLKNKKITFKFNGKKCTVKTNSKGVAKLTIKSSILKNLKVGKKVTYQAIYGKDSIKKTVKVKK